MITKIKNKKRIGGIVMAAAMAVALVVPAGVQAATYTGKIDWVTVPYGGTHKEYLTCYYGTDEYGMGWATFISNGTDAITKLVQTGKGNSVLYAGKTVKEYKSQGFNGSGTHQVTYPCKAAAAHGKVTGSYTK